MPIVTPRRVVAAVVRNKAKQFGITPVLKKFLGKAERGGAEWSARSVESNVTHVLGIYDTFAPYLGDLPEKVGLEIGPGDNVGVAYCVLRHGARKMYLVEKYATIVADQKAVDVLAALGARLPGLHPEPSEVIQVSTADGALNRELMDLRQLNFEEVFVAEPLDFAYSHDVLMHVRDVNQVYRHAFRLLRPGGLFVNSIDLAGLNAFTDRQRPLDFLTCPDWLYSLMSSHIETSNRVRQPDLVSAAVGAGFEVTHKVALHKVDRAYLASIRPHLLERYRGLSDEDLEATQFLLVARKPESA